MTEIELTESVLIIHLKGLAKIVAFMCMVPLVIPLTHVVDIVVDPRVVKKWDEIEGPAGSVAFKYRFLGKKAEKGGAGNEQ